MNIRTYWLPVPNPGSTRTLVTPARIWREVHQISPTNTILDDGGV
ncbi:MAG: hypothetical protein WCO42_00480 [bacterium]